MFAHRPEQTSGLMAGRNTHSGHWYLNVPGNPEGEWMREEQPPSIRALSQHLTIIIFQLRAHIRFRRGVLHITCGKVATRSHLTCHQSCHLCTYHELTGRGPGLQNHYCYPTPIIHSPQPQPPSFPCCCSEISDKMDKRIGQVIAERVRMMRINVSVATPMPRRVGDQPTERTDYGVAEYHLRLIRALELTGCGGVRPCDVECFTQPVTSALSTVAFFSPCP